MPRMSVVALNSTAFIPCQVSHSPQLDVTYVWYQNNRPIDFLKVIQLGNDWDVIRDPHFYRVCISHSNYYTKSLDPVEEYSKNPSQWELRVHPSCRVGMNK